MSKLTYKSLSSTKSVERITIYESTYETFTIKEEITSQNSLKTIMKDTLFSLMQAIGKIIFNFAFTVIFTLAISINIQIGAEVQNPLNNQINTKSEIQKKIDPAPKRKSKNVRQSKNLKKKKTQKQKHKVGNNICSCK